MTMLTSSLRASRSAMARVATAQVSKRSIMMAPTAIRRADLVQELYLKELRSYKPPPIKANDSEGIVQKFTPPPPPKSPEEADIASQLKAYEDQAVEVEGQAPAGEATPVEQDWFEEEPEEDEKHH